MWNYIDKHLNRGQPHQSGRNPISNEGAHLYFVQNLTLGTAHYGIEILIITSTQDITPTRRERERERLPLLSSGTCTSALSSALVLF